MKKSLFGIIFFVTLIGFVSAANLSDIFNALDEQNLVLYSVFLISFGLLYFSLGKFFKTNPAIGGIISAISAFIITFYLNKSGFDIEGYFIDIGIAEDTLFLILSVVIIAGIIFAAIKLKKDSLILIGVLSLAMSFFVYEKAFLIIVGIICLIARALIPKGYWEREKGYSKLGPWPWPTLPPHP